MMALDDGLRPLRLRDDDDDGGGGDDAAAHAFAANGGKSSAYDADGLPISRAPVPCYRRYAVCIASATCLVIVAALLGGGAIYLANMEDVARAPFATILISIDGVRADYLARNVSPNLQTIARAGVQASAMVAAFPTKTFPNHYTLVTGLEPESHGIVSNVFYDPVLNETFRYTDSAIATQAKWWGGEPIWNTAMKAGQLVACCFWPGSEAPIQGIRPTYYLPYDDDLPNDERIAQVVHWLSMNDTSRPSFVTLYFSTVDSAGHSFGPDSPQDRGASQVNAALAAADTVIGYLLGNLSAMNVLDATNIVIVSDHGMTSVDQRTRAIYIDDYINLADVVDIVEYSPIAAIWPKPGLEELVYRSLSDGATRNGNFWAYRTNGTAEQLPKPYWHYSNNVRIAPVLAVAKEGYTISRSDFSISTLQGNHGFDSADTTMKGVFLAQGPSITTGGATLTEFAAVEVYNFLAALLGVPPAQNNGTADSTLLREALRTPPSLLAH